MGEPEEAIGTLEKLTCIIPPIPIPGLKYLRDEKKRIYEQTETETEALSKVSEVSEEESKGTDDEGDLRRSVVPTMSGEKEVEEGKLPESTHFAVSTDVDCLFKIGKIAAKNGKMLEKGIACLNDFLLILEYKKPDMDHKTYFKNVCHAQYYMGVCYFIGGDR